MPEAPVWLTERLRLEPIARRHVHDLWSLHQDPEVAHWHGGVWTRERAESFARGAAAAWGSAGVHKWIAYDRRTSELVGRGGLSLMSPIEPKEGWARSGLASSRRTEQWVEVGWTVRSDLWGQGYATEIGRAGLAFGFDVLEADEVVAFTETHNTRSRGVMHRLGMRFISDILYRSQPFVLYAMGAEDFGRRRDDGA